MCSSPLLVFPCFEPRIITCFVATAEASSKFSHWSNYCEIFSIFPVNFPVYFKSMESSADFQLQSIIHVTPSFLFEPFANLHVRLFPNCRYSIIKYSPAISERSLPRKNEALTNMLQFEALEPVILSSPLVRDRHIYSINPDNSNCGVPSRLLLMAHG